LFSPLSLSLLLLYARWHAFCPHTYSHTQGVIRSVKPVDGICIVDVGGRELELPAGDLRPVLPEKLDRVRVLQGEFRGNTGELLSIEDNTNEGVVQVRWHTPSHLYLASLICLPPQPLLVTDRTMLQPSTVSPCCKVLVRSHVLGASHFVCDYFPFSCSYWSWNT